MGWEKIAEDLMEIFQYVSLDSHSFGQKNQYMQVWLDLTKAFVKHCREY